MNHFFIYFWAFLTISCSLLLLFHKVRPKLRGVCTAVAVGSFLLFSTSVYTFIQKWESDLTRSRIVDSLEQEKEDIFQEDVSDKQAIKDKVLLDVPIISQLPQLPRGCEVTSLAMLLQYDGVNVDKMELAERIKRDDTPYKQKNGQVFFGHPNIGFVGDMYNINNPGLGVYHKPIKALADEYVPDKVVDFTGGEFSEVEASLSSGHPVWVIINTRYQKLPAEEFVIWHTSVGEIDITYREHSVLITGYDENYVYVNDPLTVEKNKQIAKQDFIQAWIQMGKQAITIQ